MSATPKESEPVPAATAPLVIEVDVAAISPHPDNPRTFPKEDGDDPGLVELAASIKAVGLLEPVLVRPLVTHGTGNAPGLYQLVAGERRWRACRATACRWRRQAPCLALPGMEKGLQVA